MNFNTCSIIIINNIYVLQTTKIVVVIQLFSHVPVINFFPQSNIIVDNLYCAEYENNYCGQCKKE